jgi:dihydrofolate reductase
MAKLICAAIASLDGYVEDEEGRFEWAAPDEEVHAFVNDLERPVGTYLYGRRMYETMVFWETVSTEADEPAVFWDFAGIWRAAEKIVYSRALQTVSSARMRIEREFDRDAVRRLKQSSGADNHSRGCRARCPRNRRGACRRVPSVLVPDRGGRRQGRPARQRPRATRTSR